MRRITVALVAALLMTGLVACGSKAKTDANGVAYSASNCPTANVESFATTKVAADLGIMYVAFDRYIYKPFKADKFAKTSEKIKGAAAALAIYHFAKKVNQHVINSAFLCSKIGAPIGDLTSKLKDLPGLVRDAVTGGGSIEALKTSMSGLPGLAKGANLGNLDLSGGVNKIEDLAGIN